MRTSSSVVRGTAAGLLGALILAVTCCLAAVPGSPARASSTPASTPEPGRLLSAVPFTAYALPGVPLPARAWRVVYESRTATGGGTRVSGTVLVPRTPWRGPGARPLLGLAPGTQGMADRCAASHQWAAGTEYESAVAAQALMRGWAVAATDYQGLGTPGDHTYVVGRALGHDVLDAMRAARHLPAAGLSRRAPAAVYGFSEGGGAAAWALQLQPTYAPGLRLVAGSVGGTATDFLQLMHHIENSPFAFLELYAAIGFDAAYPELHLGRYLTPRGVAAARALRNSCIEDAIVGGLLMPTNRAVYVRPDPLASSTWLRRLHQNDLGHRAPRVPVLIGGSDLDEVFPFAQESELYDRWCARGVNAHLLRLHTPEHVITGAAFSGPGLRFIADRFAGALLSRASSCTAAR